ncbi:hypothetical protein [Streptomyces sp. SID13726]|uniref:hypothetical protein n=1 Tax=Streptomyces sp. SID13726 TaxID=2706058 RepID=UPI0013BD3481|nr:hypothetical protein [Streptomyces sp. SID13726]NEB03967.1 hypothetical protein [Streptomyces sp. SID13726]
MSTLAGMCALGSLALSVFGGLPWGSGIRLVLLFGVAASWAEWMRRRSELPTADQTLSEDPRPPVLFLRTFGRESVYFSRKELPEGLNRAQRTARRLTEDRFEAFQTVEKFLSRELNDRVGPFVALGDPADRVPREGASRNWGEDGTWEQVFLDLMPRSRCIVVAVHVSEGLAWELARVREADRQRRLFMFTPTYDEGGRVLNMVSVNNRLPGHTPERWERIVPFMRDLGYTLPEAHPGPGAVIGFGPDCEAVVLSTGASTASGYVTPLLGALGALDAEEGSPRP